MPEPLPLSAEQAEQCGRRARLLVDELGRVVLGQQPVLEQLVVTLLAGGHALLEGVPGTAKTLAVAALSQACGLGFRRIQFTPDLMPADITGVDMLDELERRFAFHPGPVFAELVLADEINRAPAKTQAALLEAMQERSVTVDGTSHPLPELFTVFATQNPVESEGTYPLPEAQLDRFLLRIDVGYPDEAAEVGILDRHAAGFDSNQAGTYGLQHRLSGGELLELRRQVRSVRVEPDVRRYIVAIVRRTRSETTLLLGASPRAAVALLRASQALALLSGRDYVVPDDVKQLAVPALRHRVLLTAEAEIEGLGADARVAAVVESVEAPR